MLTYNLAKISGETSQVTGKPGKISREMGQITGWPAKISGETGLQDTLAKFSEKQASYQITW